MVGSLACTCMKTRIVGVMVLGKRSGVADNKATSMDAVRRRGAASAT